MQQRRLIFILLVMTFMLPLLGAYWLHRHPEILGLDRTTNYGRWVKAKIDFPQALHAVRPWKLVFWHPKACDDACFEHLNQLAKLRLAMGRKLYLLDVCLYTEFPLPQAELKRMRENDIHWAYAGPKTKTKWNANFLALPIILFSPEGHALLMYPGDFSSKKMYNDLQRLMKE